MPGRLGDDPLSRKRPASAKGAPAARSDLPAQQSSHNDVFFRRRTEGSPPTPRDTPSEESTLAETTNIDEKPEITEVSDFVRTAKAAQSTQGAELLLRPMSADESFQPRVEERAEDIERTPPPVSEPVTYIEPLSPVDQEPATPASSQPEPQPQKGEGFFKRLFGRFGK